MYDNIIFHNYEVHKLFIKNPDTVNLIILFFFISIAVLTMRKNETPIPFMGRIHTDQLKGTGILLVILGHLWVHVSQQKIILTFSNDAVALFLILSGYGLTISVEKEGMADIKTFITKRIRRVMLPYWAITVLFFFIDYIFLKRTYSLPDIILTFSGVNINARLHHFDYVRWYVTFQLLWYFIFYYVNFRFERKEVLIVLFCVAAFIFIGNYYNRTVKLGWYQIFAFPTGCVLGVYREKIGSCFIEKPKKYFFISLFGLFCVIAYKLGKIFLQSLIPYIFIMLMSEFSSIVLGFILIIMMAYIGNKYRYFKILSFLGVISYEMFLLHGPFLIKYNLFMGDGKFPLVCFSFLIFLLFVSMTAYIFSRYLFRRG